MKNFLTFLLLTFSVLVHAQKVKLKFRITSYGGSVNNFRQLVDLNGFRFNCLKGNNADYGSLSWTYQEVDFNSNVNVKVTCFQKRCDTGVLGGNGNRDDEARDCAYQTTCYGWTGFENEGKYDVNYSELKSENNLINVLNPWQVKTINLSNGLYRLSFEYCWFPIAQSLEKTGEGTMLCINTPLQLRGILTLKDSVLKNNVVWEQNLNDEVKYRRLYNVCVCHRTDRCNGQEIKSPMDGSCGSDYSFVKELVIPTNPDTVRL